MSRRRKARLMHIGSGPVPLGSDAYSADYRARVKAAGLDDESFIALSADDRRFRLARKIAMFANQWTGCPETICQRMRGCMAPDIHCTNVPRLSQEELDARWPETMVVWRRALQKAKAHHERERARKAREAAKNAT